MLATGCSFHRDIVSTKIPGSRSSSLQCACRLTVRPRVIRASKRAGAVCKCDLRDKNVLIVGASRSIGFEFVRQLSSKGNKVHATVRGEGTEDLLLLVKKNALVSVGHVDVSDPSSIRSWATQLSKESDPFDYAIYVAGVVDDWADLEEVDEGKMLYCFKVNAIGALLVAQTLVENSLLRSGSVLVNLTSKMGSLADNSSGGSYAYRASKAAVNQITKSLSIDLADRGITVGLLHPGFVRTDMTRHSGLIDVDQAVEGMISVLESDLPLNGRWYDYKHEEILW